MDRACHIQGLARVGQTLVASCVDKERRRALLAVFPGAGGRASSVTDLTAADRIHPSGLHYDGTWLWNALAAYRRQGPTEVQRLDPATLEVTARFSVSDHIGCVASDPARGLLHGFNWDAKHLYTWRSDGTLVRKQENRTGLAFQDCEMEGGELWCCGLEPGTKRSFVTVLDPATTELRHKTELGPVRGGKPACMEGMTVSRDQVLLAPVDFPRAAVFELPPPLRFRSVPNIRPSKARRDGPLPAGNPTRP